MKRLFGCCVVQRRLRLQCTWVGYCSATQAAPAMHLGWLLRVRDEARPSRVMCHNYLVNFLNSLKGVRQAGTKIMVNSDNVTGRVPPLVTWRKVNRKWFYGSSFGLSWVTFGDSWKGATRRARLMRSGTSSFSMMRRR